MVVSNFKNVNVGIWQMSFWHPIERTEDLATKSGDVSAHKGLTWHQKISLIETVGS